MSADLIVIGAGASGLSLALEAAGAGRSVLVLERDGRVGGCLATHRTASGYWLELGAHTCYNSYVAVADVLDGCGLRGEVLARARTRLRFLDGNRLVPGANLRALLRRLAWGEALRSLPRAFGARKEGQTVRSYYSRIVGQRNYDNVLGPMLSAVPSQNADAFPADMLFKSRPARRNDLPRSFTLRGGLLELALAMARQPGITVALGKTATRLDRTASGFAVETEDGDRHLGSALALATAPSTTAALLRSSFPELAAQVARIRQVAVETLGFAVRASRVRLPVSMFLVPRDDVFHSVVTRDPVPDPEWRGFAFHFKPGVDPESRIRRATALLGLEPGDLEDVAERRTELPSPVLGHEQVVGEVERLTAGLRLGVTGNWFAGLSLEDCVARSRSEWTRLSAMG
ncbi:MAG: FAD-dependent oxidoreductase [Candidatus Latescibacterota bacterium]